MGLALQFPDDALDITPDLEAKCDIVQNAIGLAHVLGIPTPRVAILSAVETVTPKMPSTLEAAALCKMADRGQITGGVVDGPLAFDNAVSPQAARTEGIVSPVAGRADILVVPDLEAGNILAKHGVPGQCTACRPCPGRTGAHRPHQPCWQFLGAHGLLFNLKEQTSREGPRSACWRFFSGSSATKHTQLVAALAPAGKGALHLAQIVNLPDMMSVQEYTAYDEAVREQVVRAATLSMHRVAEQLRSGVAAELALQVTWSVSVQEDVADALMRRAELGEEAGSSEGEGCDLLVMATPGLSGWQRWMVGSITERVLDGTTLPLLIVRPQERDTSITRELTEEEALHVLPF